MTTIQPMFFGPDESLFGVYHPAANKRRNHAVVIAAPLLNEYLRTHITLVQVARSLANAGYDVFRFDYLGTGCSDGDLVSAGYRDWFNSLLTAVDVVTELSGASKLSIVAVRFAASLAARVTHERVVESLVLWDPVMDGPTWKASILEGQKDFLKLYPEETSLLGTDVMGYVTREEFYAEITEIAQVPIQSQAVYALITEGNQAAGALESSARSIVKVDYDCQWNDMEVPVVLSPELVSEVCRAFQ